MSFLKKVSVLLMFALCLGFVTSCGNKNVSLSTEEIYKNAISGVELPELQKVSAGELEGLFKLNSSDFDEQSVYISMINVRASEIGLFKFSTKEQEKLIDDAISKRLQDLDATWSTYLPDQYELVKNAKVITIGNLKAYIVADDSDKIVSNISKAVK